MDNISPRLAGQANVNFGTLKIANSKRLSEAIQREFNRFGGTRTPLSQLFVPPIFISPAIPLN
jgi:hypothetical protein